MITYALTVHKLQLKATIIGEEYAPLGSTCGSDMSQIQYAVSDLFEEVVLSLGCQLVSDSKTKKAVRKIVPGQLKSLGHATGIKYSNEMAICYVHRARRSVWDKCG